MTDQIQTPESEEPQTEQTEVTDTPAKPPISKASAEETEGQMTPIEVKPEAMSEVEPATDGPGRAEANVQGHGRPNGQAPAETVSQTRQALLEVDSYDEAEALLTEQPDLIEPARIVFGHVVPTTGQNAFMDLAIKAAADDDPLTLTGALQTKRQNHINLTAPEVDQLLEFATETMAQSPELCLYIAILITDDLTHLKEAGLWQRQKHVITTTADRLGIDAIAIWEEVNGVGPKSESAASPPEAEPKPAPEPVKAETVVTPTKKPRPAPPLPPVKKVRKPHPRHRHDHTATGRPPRWVVASGFIFLLSMMSCGVCALSMF